MRTVSLLALVLLLLTSCGGEVGVVNNTSADLDVIENMLDSNMSDIGMDSNDQAALDDAANAIANDNPPTVPNVAMTTDGRIYCDVIADFASSADCDYYRALSSRLESGSAALNAPARMTRGVPAQVEFAIARPPSPDRPAAVDNATDLLTGDPTLTKAIPVGRRMAVQLEGEGFTIAPEGLREADLGITGGARWQWRVTPERGGSRRLVLSAYVIVEAPGGARGQHLIRTMHQDVEVAVAAGEQADSFFAGIIKWLGNLKNLLGALAAVVLAAVGLRAAWRKYRRGDEAAPGAAGQSGGPSEEGAQREGEAPDDAKPEG